MRVSHHHQGTAPGTGFIDPRTLARIDTLELVARFVVDGFINGLHKSPYLGMSSPGMYCRCSAMTSVESTGACTLARTATS